MAQILQRISVKDIARICGVARSTVSYWIAKKYLPAHRFRNKNMVLLDDLVTFLRSEDHPVPQDLLEHSGAIYSQPFKPFKRCWEFWTAEPHGKKCKECNIFLSQTNECFSARNNQDLQCPCHINCYECQYFGEYYGPRVSFIHQIEKPAVIYKDLNLWMGNKAWVKLCGAELWQLIGAGLEEFLHPDSLKICNRSQVSGFRFQEKFSDN